MSQPNIVFVLVDDLGWADLSCQGSVFYETPHIDRLAAEGMAFTDAYAAAPVCSPTRASLMTGKYPARVGVTQYIGGSAQGKLLDVPYIDHLPHSEHSIAAALRDGGYQTWHVGKWHLGGEPYWPDRHGFDVNLGGCDWGMPAHGYFSPYRIATLPDGPDGEHLPDRLTDEALNLIAQRDADRPFFLNLWYYLVHTPIEAPPELVAKYQAKARAMELDQQNPFEVGEPFPCEHKRHQRITRRTVQSDPTYAAMVETLDTNVGRLLDQLDALGIADDTLVVFTSDNGGLATAEGSPTCNAPLAEGKGWMYEGGNREPLLVRWPGVIKPRSTCSEPVTSPDFYPTLLEAAQLGPLPTQHIDGKSFIPALRSEPFERGPIYWHYPHYSNQGGAPGCAIREGDWKLIQFFEDHHVELYHLPDDIGEHNNLADDKPQRTFALQQQLECWLEDIEATIPKPNPDYVPPTDPASDPSV